MGVRVSPSITLRILGFLWQWKLATTAVLSFKFFREIKPHSAYKRLKAIEKRGLIQIIPDPTGAMFFWVLTKRGFSAIKEHLPALEQDGFKSENMYHDHLVLSFHIGDWLAGLPDGALYIAEQQLRRYPKCEYPAWVPKDDSHRPDGYWSVGGKVISVEVELSCKTEGDYYSIALFYDWQQSIHAVFWLVPSTTIAKRIRNYLESARPARIEMHHFVMLPDFKEKGWAAMLTLGAKQGKTLREILGKYEGNSWELFPTELLLDIGKCSMKHRSYARRVREAKQLLTPISS